MFTFITMNDTRIASKLPSVEEMDNSIIVVDEVHMLINGYRNDSSMYVALFERLLDVQNCRFILLSGTPIAKDHLDLYVISKLLAPGMFESEEEYEEYFETREGRARVAPLLQRIISRVSASENPDEYPTVKIVQKAVTLLGEQKERYTLAKKTERENLYPANESDRTRNPDRYQQRKTAFYIAYSMIKSRQLTNMYYPEEVTDDDIDMDFVDNLKTYAPKIDIIVKSIQRFPGKHVVFSQFKSGYGIEAIAKILSLLEIPYLKFTGDMDDSQRCDVTTKFNALTNLRGEEYKVLLMTEAGSQGQNFLHVRRQYILEQSIDELQIQQVMGRVNRYRSHADLPPEERNLTIVRFFATTEPAITADDLKKYSTSDYDAYIIGQKRLEKSKKILKVMNTLKVAPESEEETTVTTIA